ncbi:BolA-like protein 3 [Oryzias melastigma]|uniref:BolA-like protein 3 n=1 Tax=Oryzias melastigma TaxID=30732 RepID=A0A834C5W2_ORYME|nr:BolA-like protein 3 [Oryzias melastigma]
MSVNANRRRGPHRQHTEGEVSIGVIAQSGCGAMYEIHIESSEFKGKKTVQQHQLVNQALKDEIQGMHGLRIFTEVPNQ